jgi:hypothetical protein
MPSETSYRTPPDTGTVIVKDKDETWEAVSAQPARRRCITTTCAACEGMIDAGSGYPPHWRGEAADANLATAQAMQTPYRAPPDAPPGLLRLHPGGHPGPCLPAGGGNRGAAPPAAGSSTGSCSPSTHRTVSRQDNQLLARSAKDIAEALRVLEESLPKRSKRLGKADGKHDLPLCRAAARRPDPGRDPGRNLTARRRTRMLM